MANAFNQFSSGFDEGNAMADQFAKQSAGNALAGGDYTGAANTLYRSGQLDAGSSVQSYGQSQHRQEIADRAAFFLKAASALSQIPDDGTQTARKAALNHLVPTFKAMGIDDSTIGQLQNADLSNSSLAAFGANLQRELELVHGPNGEIGTFNKGTGAYNVVRQGEAPKPFEMDPAKNYLIPDASNTGQAQAGAAPQDQAAPDADTVWQNIVKQESGGKPGVVGPQTKYGQAQGETQLLPQTAKAMAQKLGVPWRPDLMTAKTPEGEAYQLKLGRAYFDEGVQQNGGDVAKAAAYYYAGPNAALHGPKTAAYVKAVTGGSQVAQASQDQPAPAGYRYLQRAQAGVDGSALDPGTTKLLAGRYLKDGTLPPMGMGKAAAASRAAILNEANTQAKALGLTADDLVAGTVSVKAGASALSKVRGLRAQVQASEATVEKNADYALKLSQKVGGPTGVPVLNRWIQAGRKNIAGDADVAQLNAALGTVADEYAKVMTSSTGTGATTSDSARNEAYKRINSAMTPQQLDAVVKAMKVEMANRLESLNDTEAGILTAIRGTNSGAPGQPAPQPTAVASAGQQRIRIYNPKTGGLD